MRIWPEKTVDQEFADLAAAGHFGSLNDRQFSYLRSQGLTGGLADMMFQWRSGGGGSPGGSFSSATWEIAYSDTVTTSAANGATVSGLPYGLTGTVSGGVLTVEGTPQ